MAEELDEYEVTMKLLVRSSLDREKLRQLLVVALWVDTESGAVIPDGGSDELEVIEYQEITVEEAVNE